MTDPNYYADIIEIADAFTDARRKSEATEVINMLRTALVRSRDEASVGSVILAPGSGDVVEGSSGRADLWQPRIVPEAQTGRWAGA